MGIGWVQWGEGGGYRYMCVIKCTLYMLTWCVYDKDHISALQINLKKAPQKFWGSNGIQTYDLDDTGAMLYRPSYEALLEAGQVWVLFIPVIWREWGVVYMIKIIWVHCRIQEYKNTSESDLSSYKESPEILTVVVVVSLIELASWQLARGGGDRLGV